MTLAEALQVAGRQGLARLDAQRLLLFVLGRPFDERAWLLAHDADDLPAPLLDRFSELVARRADGEPLAYITGEREFFGLRLRVDARVLDPRPDTETLVEWALEVVAPIPAPSVIDLGTGSGAIALALQRARPDARVVAVDASADALCVARSNAQRLTLPVEFILDSWLDHASGPFHMIVSNPPYVAAGDVHLTGLRHEPQQALVSGTEGLDDLHRIIEQAPQHLVPGGWLLLEHGWDQAAAVRAALSRCGFVHVQSRNDLAGIERCSGGQYPALR